jgi:hypothetical protein
MKRLAILLLPLLAAGCMPAQAPLPGAQRYALLTPHCRTGVDGGPMVADRGIGGTGAPASLLPDWGAGGLEGVRSADRGIVGIVGGFAGVCVDGLEVSMNARAPIDFDGVKGEAGDLRAGQMVAISAGLAERTIWATKISVRHEVSGPVEAFVSGEPGLVLIAGQRVRVPVAAPGASLVHVGAWLAISGLHRADGEIVASRVDPAPEGRVTVHGALTAAHAIGGLAVRPGQYPNGPPGSYVVATGSYRPGVLEADSVAPDPLMANPPAYFGPGTKHLVIEAHTMFETGAASLAGGYGARAAPGFVAPDDINGPAVVSLDVQPDGTFAVIQAYPAPGGGLPDRADLGD